jgi:hypothetical protein
MRREGGGQSPFVVKDAGSTCTSAVLGADASWQGSEVGRGLSAGPGTEGELPAAASLLVRATPAGERALPGENALPSSDAPERDEGAGV